MMAGLAWTSIYGDESDQEGVLERVSSTWCDLTGCWIRSGDEFDASVGIEQRVGARPTFDDAHDALT